MSEYDEYASTFSETEVRSKEFVYTWKINNFVAAHPGLEQSIDIKKNINGNELWFLSLFPDGLDATSPEYVGIVVSFFKSEVEIESAAYLFRICIVDKNKKEHEMYKLMNLENENHIIITKFVKKDDLFDEKNELLVNGNLILRFRIYFPGEIVEKLTLNTINEPKRDGFESIFNKEKFSDVKIVVGEKTFWMYKGILSAQSPVFSAMFEHDMKENNENAIEITDIDQEVVQEMLRFTYVGQVNNIEKIARDLLTAADKYEIEDLKLKCEEALINDLSVETVVSSLIFAEKHRANLLKNKSLEFFKIHANNIVANQKCKADCNNISPVLLEIIATLA